MTSLDKNFFDEIKNKIPMLEFKGRELRQLKKWIAALDSGKYPQGSGALQSGIGFCCLGVAVKAIIPKSYQDICDDDNALLGNFPHSQPHAPSWLKAVNSDFSQRAGTPLSMLNDDGGFTFSEIATLLELVYIHKILDYEFL